MNIRETSVEVKQKDKDLSDVSQQTVNKVIRGLFEVLKNQLSHGESVTIKGFGTFRFYWNSSGNRVRYDFKSGEMKSARCKPKIKFDNHFDFDSGFLKSQETEN